MENIKKIINRQSKLRRYQKPLEAAEVCQIAAEVGEGRFDAISFKNGLLALACASTMQAAILQPETEEIIKNINARLGENKVKKIRFKISNN